MALTHTPPGELGSLAPDFALLGVDGRTARLADFKGARALVVIFMCNHCPYVQAVDDRINTLAREYAPRGVSVIAINPNDAQRYPDDSFAAMQERARQKDYAFHYLVDESQSVARAYGAVCTPDFFAYAPVSSGQWSLSYRGRLDDSWKDESKVTRRDLAHALDGILAGETPLAEQPSSMGCSIKWIAQ